MVQKKKKQNKKDERTKKVDKKKIILITSSVLLAVNDPQCVGDVVEVVHKECKSDGIISAKDSRPSWFHSLPASADFIVLQSILTLIEYVSILSVMIATWSNNNSAVWFTADSLLLSSAPLCTSSAFISLRVWDIIPHNCLNSSSCPNTDLTIKTLVLVCGDIWYISTFKNNKRVYYKHYKVDYDGLLLCYNGSFDHVFIWG